MKALNWTNRKLVRNVAFLCFFLGVAFRNFHWFTQHVQLSDTLIVRNKERISPDRVHNGAVTALLIARNELPQDNTTRSHYQKIAEWHIDTSVLNQDNNCLVYSFGVGTHDPYTDFMAQYCTVIAMDPSVTSYKQHPNITHYSIGLKANPNVQLWSHPVYGKVNASSLHSLPEIIKLLGHEGRTIAAIKFDCEGCEFGAFRGLLHLPNRILSFQTEFHFTTTLGMNSTQDVARIGDFGSFFRERGCLVGSFRRNKGFRRDRQVYPALVEYGVPDGVCCYEYTFSCHK